MARTLEDIKGVLYNAFDAAVENYKAIDESSSNVAEKANARSNALQTVAKLADSIDSLENNTKLRDLIDRAEKNGSQIVLEINQGISKDVKPLASIKLKQPGQ